MPRIMRCIITGLKQAPWLALGLSFLLTACNSHLSPSKDSSETLADSLLESSDTFDSSTPAGRPKGGGSKPMFFLQPQQLHLSALAKMNDDECFYRVWALPELSKALLQEQLRAGMFEASAENTLPKYRLRAYLSSSDDAASIANQNLSPLDLSKDELLFVQFSAPRNTTQYLFVQYEAEDKALGVSRFSPALALAKCEDLYHKQAGEAGEELIFDYPTYEAQAKLLSCPPSPKYKAKPDINKHSANSDQEVTPDDFLGASYHCNEDFSECYVHRRHFDPKSQEPALKLTLTPRLEDLREHVEEVVKHFNQVAEELNITPVGVDFVTLDSETRPFYITCERSFVEVVPKSSGILGKHVGISDYQYSAVGELWRTNILLNADTIFSNNNRAYRLEVQYILAHEIGHSLGMDHNFVAQKEGFHSIMDYNSLDTILARGFQLSDYDRAVLKYLYSDQAKPKDLMMVTPEGKKKPWPLLRQQPGQKV